MDINYPSKLTSKRDRGRLAISIRCYHGGFRLVAAIFSVLALEVPSAIAVPPANDNFANRITLTAGVTATTDTTNATREPGEPNVRGSDHPSDYTVWYTWTASSDSIVSIDNIGSEIRDDFVAVYLGTALNKLVDVDNEALFLTGSTGGEIRLSFPVKAGTTLQIQAGSTTGGRGKLQITLSTKAFNHVGQLFGPQVSDAGLLANDNFSGRSLVMGREWTAIGYLLDATIEGSEPNKPFANVHNTVWFMWTAPSDCEVTIDTTGTTVSGHLFAVYVGQTISDVAPVAGDNSSNTVAAATTFSARGGVTYIIAAGAMGSSPSGTLVLTLTSAPPLTGSLSNLSTRMAVGTGNSVLIAGFIITGGAKNVVVRGIGPSLAQYHIANPLSDPYLELHDGTGALIAQNNDWQENPNQASAIQASGLAPPNAHESALLLTLQPGSYTAVLGGVNNGVGVGLVEVYDTDGTGAAAKAVNVATRGYVSTGDSVMIAGFIVGGSDSGSIVVRGIGPSLAGFGIANALQNPELDLYDGNGRKLISVDNWRDMANYGAVIAAGLAPSDSRECAIAASFSPGNYTAVLSGINNTSGIGLVEVYNLRPQ
jgi:hypothetical protein